MLADRGINFERRGPLHRMSSTMLVRQMIEFADDCTSPGARQRFGLGESLANVFLSIAVNHRIVLPNTKGQNWLARSLRCQELIKCMLVLLANIGVGREFLQMRRNVVLDIRTAGDGGSVNDAVFDPCRYPTSDHNHADRYNDRRCHRELER